MVAVLRAPGAGAREDSIVYSRTGDAVVEAGGDRWYAERDLTLLAVDLSAGDAPGVGGTLEYDVLVDAFEIVPGGSIFTTAGNRPKLAAGEHHMTTPAPDVTVLAAGSYITVDTLSVGGSGTPGAKVVLRVLYE